MKALLSALLIGTLIVGSLAAPPMAHAGAHGPDAPASDQLDHEHADGSLETLVGAAIDGDASASEHQNTLNCCAMMSGGCSGAFLQVLDSGCFDILFLHKSSSINDHRIAEGISLGFDTPPPRL